MKNLRKNNKGFTIIEVMIVLVIAAIILLIVFLAIPALQRNSRNTQRKNDVAAILAALNEYMSNSGGVMPNSGSDFIDNAKLGFYDPSSEVFYVKTVTSDGEVGDDFAPVIVGGKVRCEGNAASITGATSKQIAAVYNVETSSGLNQAQCQEG